VSRPTPDTLEAKVVWVSGAVTPLTLHPPIRRAADVGRYEEFVARVAALAADGYTDAAIARRLTAEGFRSARTPAVPTPLVAKLRRSLGQASLTEQFRRREQIEGQWTVWGLSRLLGVTRNWLYDRMAAGTVPATRHPTTGHHLIPNDPALIARLRAAIPARRRT